MSDEEAPSGNESRMTMIEHLTELRRRLIIAFASVGIGAIIAWIFYPQIIEFLLEPYCRTLEAGEECQLYVRNPLEPFSVRLTVAGYGGIIVAMPMILWQFWAFVAPGLYSHEKRYDATSAYSQSKLANLMYGLELQRRLEARGSRVTSITCHPGYAATNLQSSGVGMDGGSIFLRWLYKLSNRTVAQTATEGAYPLCLAAADPNARAGAYYGPTGLMNARGPVGECSMHRKAKDTRVAAALWDKTEELVGPFFSQT